MNKLLCVCGCSKQKKRSNKRGSTVQTEATDLKEGYKNKRIDSYDTKKSENNNGSRHTSINQAQGQEKEAIQSKTPQIQKVPTPKKPEERISNSIPQERPKVDEPLVVTVVEKKETELNSNSLSSVIKMKESNSTPIENKPKEEEKEKEEVKAKESVVNIEIEKKPSERPMIIPAVEEDENERWLIPKDSRLICPYEKGVIEFSPNGLGRFLDSLDKLIYAPLYNKNNLEINIRREGSPVNSKTYLFRSIYTQKKSELGENANVPNIVRLMYRLEDRVKWDTTLKLLKKYEGDERAFVVRTWCHRVVIFISEREGIEKRMLFTYNGIPTVLSTSVNDDYIPEEKGVVRITNYINAIRIDQDEENFYFICYNQHDFKMPIPQAILNFTLPSTTANWFINFQKTAEKTELDPILFDFTL